MEPGKRELGSSPCWVLVDVGPLGVVLLETQAAAGLE